MFNQKQSLAILSQYVDSFPSSLVVLGSGWSKILNDVAVEQEIGYDMLFGVKTTVPGHSGKLIIGSLNGTRAAFMSGRFHMYEGYSAWEATSPIRLFAQKGLERLVLTAACGALNKNYKIGDVVILNDMITLLLSLDSPLKGPQFIDTSNVFDNPLRQKAVEVCKENNIPYQEGSYIYYHGPNFETPSDKRAMQILGADVCGMSTVPETLVARSLNIRVLGLAFVTNLAFVKHDHNKVLKEAEKGSERMRRLLGAII